MNLKSLPIIAALALSPVAANATCYRDDFSTYGSRLEQGMTEYQAKAAVGGWVPNWVQVDLCGASTASGPWDCKIEIWGSPCNGALTVWFAKHNGVWLVDSWTPTESTTH